MKNSLTIVILLATLLVINAAIAEVGECPSPKQVVCNGKWCLPVGWEYISESGVPGTSGNGGVTGLCLVHLGVWQVFNTVDCGYLSEDIHKNPIGSVLIGKMGLTKLAPYNPNSKYWDYTAPFWLCADFPSEGFVNPSYCKWIDEGISHSI